MWLAFARFEPSFFCADAVQRYHITHTYHQDEAEEFRDHHDHQGFLCVATLLA